MKSIEHYEQLAREAKVEGCGRKQWTFRDLREWLDAMMTSVGDDEIEGMTLDQLDLLPVVVRIATADGCEVGALTSADVEGGCADSEALMLDGEFDAQPALGPSNDEPIAVRLEMELAEHLADTCMLYEPGADRETLEDWLVEGAAVRAHAIINHDAEQAETGGGR